jgi:Transposase DDE domain
LPDDEGAFRHGAAADNRVRREPAGADLPRLGGAGLQHAVATAEDPEGEHPLPRLGRPAPPAGRQQRDQGRGRRRKYGGTKRRVWRKIHIGIDEKSLEIRAAEFTTSDVGDAPMLPELPGQIPPEQEIDSVTADSAFDTRKCHDAIAARGAAAIIPPRKNAKTVET